MSPEQVYHSQNKICAAELSSRNMPSTSRLTPPHPHSACAQTTAALVWEPGQCPAGLRCCSDMALQAYVPL